MREHRASRTAVLVCQARAAADGRVVPERFRDPTAGPLLREDERAPVTWVRAGHPPSGVAPRMEFELVRACAEVLVPRTVTIDDALRDRANPQVVLLGAGLDGRAWRMPELAGATVFEVDHPASQADKRDRAAALPPPSGRHTYVPVDFATDELAGALAAAGHDDDAATTWVWEGVVPYLSRDEVAATVAEVAARSAAGSRLVVNYQSPSIVATAGRLLARGMMTLARQRPYWADEPRRSAWTPAGMAALLAGHGFGVTADDDLVSLAVSLGSPTSQGRSLREGRVAVADFGRGGTQR